jgi:hypothetical protein
MLDLDEEFRLDIFRKDVYKDWYRWLVSGCTPLLHDYVVHCTRALWDPCWNMARFAILEWPGLICYDWKALGLMCSTPSLRVLSGTSSGKICEPEF